MKVKTSSFTRPTKWANKKQKQDNWEDKDWRRRYDGDDDGFGFPFILENGAVKTQPTQIIINF